MPDSREHPIRLRYSHIGTQPPVYIAASFTSPPWDPIEMDSAPAPSVGDGQDGGNELEFFKDFNVAEGHWHYKFRLGPGDWWVCNETIATEMDGSGNYNNVLVVEPSLTPDTPEETHAHVRPLAEKDRGDVHETAWEVSAAVDSRKQTAVETRSGLEAPISASIDETELTGSQDRDASESAKSLTDDPNPTPEPRANEPSPLFAHECLTPEHEEAEVYLHDPEEAGTRTDGEARILDDCELEMFPTDREHILQRIMTTKVCLDEDQTSPDGIPSPTSVPPQVVVDSLPSSSQSTPQLGAIEEEDMSDVTVPPPLDAPEPVQPDQGAGAPDQVLTSSEATEATGSEDATPSGHPSMSEDSVLPVGAHTPVLDPGLATLGPRQQTVEQHPAPQAEAENDSPGLDGAADFGLIDSTTPKLQAQRLATAKSPVLGRRQSVPGSFEGGQEDVDQACHFQKATLGDSRGGSGEVGTSVNRSWEEKDPGNGPVTPKVVNVSSSRKYDNLFQAFWRLIMVGWLGTILARFSWKSSERA